VGAVGDDGGEAGRHGRARRLGLVGRVGGPRSSARLHALHRRRDGDGDGERRGGVGDV
jgi:hypothetical protein